MKPILILLISLSLAGCLGGGSRRPSVTSNRPDGGGGSAAASQLRGQWTLTSLETQGQPRRASGQLSFDASDNISLRAEVDPGEPGVTPPRTILLDFVARAIVSGDELTYVGLQQRAPADRLMPTASDPSAWRHFSVQGDTLRIWLEDGGRQVGALTFQRSR